MANHTALITGASSGIGRELAHRFAADGHDLVVIARRAAALDELVGEMTRAHGVKARAIAADLAQPAAARHIYDELSRAGTPIDVIVNNAGFGLQGTVAQLALDRQLEMIQVNVTALTELTRLFLPGMLERNAGGVLNVGSTAGFQPGPMLAVYYATKAYVVSFTEALAEEVAGSALRVSCLAPGPTATGFAEEAHMTESRLFRLGTMNAADVARIGYQGWKRRKVLVIPGMTNRFGVAAVRLSPRSIVRKLLKQLNT
ncbi:MAG: SDR family NAD(P)-dependent oxidoreductase [bacterium]